MSKVVLFGIGRGADVAFRFLTRDSDHEICGFAVDRRYLDREHFHDLPVVPFEDVESRFPPDQFKMFVLLGYQRMNAFRADKYLEAKRKGYSFISYTNSSFYQSISLDVKIGNNVVMWSSNHVGDLTNIGDHVWLASHVTVAAEVIVQPYCFLGIGATIGNRVTLAERTFVAANALVASDTVENAVCVTGESERVDVDSGTFLRVMTAKRKL
jgi:acetyltransferase-like isoleucine patch superfamily enzyme